MDKIENSTKKSLHEELLRGVKIKVTKPRLAVLECLSAGDRPLSPKEILEKINSASDEEQIDQVTIYRILDTFSKVKLIHKVFPSGGFLICEHPSCSRGIHILLTCTQCHKANEVEIPNEVFASTLWFLENKYEFSINKHLFQIDGVCSECKNLVLCLATTRNSP